MTFHSAELKMSASESFQEQLGFSFAETERNPEDLVAKRFRPVLTIGGYPEPLPDDIAEYIDPKGDNRTIRLVGPMSSIFWLGRLDDFVYAIDSPDFTVRDEIICIPDNNASIRSMLPLLYKKGKIPSAIYRN